MKIEKVTLRNIQKHERLTIELGSGNNAMLGHNNSGKSSIIRSLYWALTNSPLGDWMCRKTESGTKLHEAYVKIYFTDGNTLVRGNGPKGGNVYKFNNEKFTGFGRNIPEPIAEYLGKTKIELGNTEITPNLSSCLTIEMPFLIGETAPVRGSVLNYLTGIDIADKIKRDFEKEIRADKKEAKWVSGKMSETESALEPYENIPELLSRIQKVIKSKAKYDNLVSLLERHNKVSARLQAIGGEVITLEKRVDKLAPLLVRGNAYMALERAFNTHQAASKRLNRLHQQLANENAVSGLKKALDKYYKMLLHLNEFCQAKDVSRIEENIRSIQKELDKFKICSKCKRVL